MELLRIRELWFIFPLMGVSYALSGAIRGLWVGPYLADVFNADTGSIGQATLWMSIAMILGVFAYGPLDRLLPSRKWMIAGGTAITLAAAAVLITLPAQNFALSVAMVFAIGFFGATYPVIMSHGRAFLPRHLIGRGVTMLNLFSIGGVGVLQFVSGRVYTAFEQGPTTTPYVAVFTMLAGFMALGLVIYLFARDNND